MAAAAAVSPSFKNRFDALQLLDPRDIEESDRRFDALQWLDPYNVTEEEDEKVEQTPVAPTSSTATAPIKEKEHAKEEYHDPCPELMDKLWAYVTDKTKLTLNTSAEEGEAEVAKKKEAAAEHKFSTTDFAKFQDDVKRLKLRDIDIAIDPLVFDNDRYDSCPDKADIGSFYILDTATITFRLRKLVLAHMNLKFNNPGHGGDHCLARFEEFHEPDEAEGSEWHDDYEPEAVAPLYVQFARRGGGGGFVRKHYRWVWEVNNENIDFDFDITSTEQLVSTLRKVQTALLHDHDDKVKQRKRQIAEVKERMDRFAQLDREEKEKKKKVEEEEKKILRVLETQKAKEWLTTKQREEDEEAEKKRISDAEWHASMNVKYVDHIGRRRHRPKLQK